MLQVRGFGHTTTEGADGLSAGGRRYGTYLRNRTYNLFMQDNWRVRSNLTFNLGVRYEYNEPSYEKYNRLVGLDAAPDFTAVAQVFPDRTGPLSGQYFSRSLVGADRNNIGPRIGIAWKPNARSPLVVRTGYGVFYNASAYSSIVGHLAAQPPFAVAQNLPTDRFDPLTLQNGFPSNPDLNILNTVSSAESVGQLQHCIGAKPCQCKSLWAHSGRRNFISEI
jgi:outer membrane receptor protein involved in Fe transport